jgi:adenylate cyclase
LIVRVEGYEPVECAGGRTLLEVCEDAAIPMDSACGGFAACNSCRVDVLDGADRLSGRLPEEEPFLDTDRQRLGCQARVLGDVAIRLAPGA